MNAAYVLGLGPGDWRSPTIYGLDMSLSESEFSKFAAAIAGEPSDERRYQRRYAGGGVAKICWSAGELREQQMEGQIIDYSKTGLALALSRPLEVGENALISVGQVMQVKVVVRHSRKDGDQYVIGLFFLPEPRTKSGKQPEQDSVVLQWPDLETGNIHSIEADLQDTSENTMRIFVPEIIPEGTVIRLSGGRLECLATARKAEPHDGRYLLEIEVIGRPYAKGPAASEE